MRFNSFEGRFCLTCCELWMPSVAGRFRVWNVPLLFKRVWTSEGARARSQKRLVPTQCFLYQVGFERNFQKNCFYILHAARLLEVKMCDLKKKKKKEKQREKKYEFGPSCWVTFNRSLNSVIIYVAPTYGFWHLIKKKKKRNIKKLLFSINCFQWLMLL